MNRNMQYPILTAFRASIALNAIASWYGSQENPKSSFFHIGQSVDGDVILWLMALFAVAILADVVLNDLLRKLAGGQCWRRAFSKRHYLLVGLACCYWAQPYVALRAGRPVESLSTFAWIGLIIFILAFFDAKHRSKESRCAETVN